jgi:hypothetical protein
LFIADLFHPVGALAVELFHNGDVRHGRGGRCSVPMLFIRWEADRVSRLNFLIRLPLYSFTHFICQFHFRVFFNISFIELPQN